MRIGLFGGTFDPIHWGHLRSAEEVREALCLDRVLFIPTPRPPHKRSQTITSAQHRLEMVRRAVAGNPNFAVSTIEIERPGISYSVDTVRHFAKKSAGRDSYFFIIGFDAFRDIASWKDYKEIFPLCHFVVTSRPGTGNGPYPLRRVPVAVRTAFCYSFKQKAYKHRSGTFLYVVRLTDIAISASDIRRRVNEGRSIRYLVPSEVEAYIEKHGIYQEPLEGR